MIWYLYRLYSILSYKIFANFLVLYILCLIYFTSSWHLLIPYLKYASPLSFFLLMTTSLSSVSMSLLLFCYICWLTLFFYIPHISENIRYLSISVSISVRFQTIIPSRSTHIVTSGEISFFLSWNIPFIHIIYHCICIPHIPDPFICWWALRLVPYFGYCK